MDSKIEIKNSGIDRKGVFAITNIKKGEIVNIWHPKKIVTEVEMKTLPEDEQNHTTPDGIGNYMVMGEPERYVNHSCNPNTYVHNKTDIALRDIKKGEEITSDYSINGINSWEMRCLCGNKNCRKIVYGDFFKLPRNIQRKYYPYLEDWFKEKFKDKLKLKSKMKRAFIVHGWDFNPKMNWYPWLRKELERKGYEVIVPEMPNTSEPVINEWVSHLKKVVGELDKDTYFIGHSIGCQTIMRFLEKENYAGKIPKIVFIAGWFKLCNLEGEEVEFIAKPWLEEPIDYDKVKQKIRQLTVFLSNNDPYNSMKENEMIFKDKLGAKVVILKEKGHFTEDDGVNNLPEILNEIN